MTNKYHVAELARALRQQLEWQSSLGASGAPSPNPEELAELRGRIRKARMTKVLGGGPSDRGPEAAHQRVSTPAQRPEVSADRGRERERAASVAPRGRAAASTKKNPARAADPYQTLGRLEGQHEPVSSPSPEDGPRPSKGSRGEAQARLRAVQQELGQCDRCKLAATRRHIVFGVGDPLADLVFVGEAPGLNEDRKGEPFVGRAGQLLTKMIGAMGYQRSDVYILNIVKCRPPGNRDPELDEMTACEPFLIKQLEALRPRVIVTLGRYAAQALLRERTGIKRLRGKWRTYQGIKLMPTFHPAYVLRYDAARRPVWDDLQLVMTELSQPD